MRYVNAGTMELWYVATVGNPAAPTSTELNAGVNLTPFLTDTGVDTPFEGSLVDTADMDDKFNETVSGTYGGQPVTAEFHREKAEADDTAYTTLPFGTTGYFAIASRGLATKGTWAIGDRVDLIPIDVIARVRANVGRNQNPRFRTQAGVPGVPLDDFALVA